MAVHFENPNPLLKPFIDSLNREQVSVIPFEAGISCFVKGLDPHNRKITTKIEIVPQGPVAQSYFYVNGNMQKDDTVENHLEHFIKIKDQIILQSPENNFDCKFDSND